MHKPGSVMESGFFFIQTFEVFKTSNILTSNLTYETQPPKNRIKRQN
jgi:hypothetical protein